MAGSASEGDEIRLEVPTTPDLLRLVRVTASGLASRLGLPFDAVEDVRLAVDELCWAVAGKAGPGSTLDVRLVVTGGRSFEVEGRVRPGPGGAPVAASLTGVTERILATLVASYRLLPAVDGLGPGFAMATKGA